MVAISGDMAKHGYQKLEKPEFNFSHGRVSCCILLLSSIVWWVFLSFYVAVLLRDGRTEFRIRNSQKDELRLIGINTEDINNVLPVNGVENGPPSEEDCNGKYVYMYSLPSKFNDLLLKKCEDLSVWTNMCPHVANSGLGKPITDLLDNEAIINGGGWFGTNQFTAEVIFHERMKNYRCLTPHASRASAFYVPFYAGFDMSRNVQQMNFTERDRLGAELLDFLRNQPQWKNMQGRDHFLVIGRITWDFLRESRNSTSWGNRLLLLPEVKNMSVLLIEAHPWHDNEHGIPYPSYFHPSRRSQVLKWQQVLRSKNRNILFSFAGAPRPGLVKASIRAHIFQQCQTSPRCRMLKCGQGPSICHNPSHVMRLFMNSVFCLQPQGDSFTRRSIFDSMLAGCIPVFFTEHSAYTQYRWHLPSNRTSYSVFITEETIVGKNASIESHLQSFSRDRVESMRREVIRLIPSLVYADPRGHGALDFRDSFDIAVEGVLNKIIDARNANNEGMKE